MPGYANIGGSWRELSGGGYANIGGTWRQISEGYQLRNGVWEQVFPNYTDYGDFIDMFDNGMITYGYWAYTTSNHSGGTGLKTGTSVGSSQASSSCYLNNPDEGDPYDATPHWFPTQQAIDLRGYNYLAAYIRPYFSNGSTNDYALPFFSISTSPTSAPLKDSYYKSGTEIRSTSSGTACTFYLYVDLSKCALSDVYLNVGAVLRTTASSVATTVTAYIRSSAIYLYKNSSDDPFSSESGDKQTLTYS